VQLFTSRAQVAPDAAIFGPYRGKTVERASGGWYKYSLGPYTALDEAIRDRDEAKRGQFKDAFIIALDGDTQITIDEARRRINRQ
jgi:hypothetical protein